LAAEREMVAWLWGFVCGFCFALGGVLVSLLVALFV
jgi:hypothetical protein